MKEKKCKHCTMMIPSEAKICPHCRKKQGSSFFLKIAILLIGLYLISKLSVPSYESYRERAQQTAGKIQEQGTITGSQNINTRTNTKKAVSSNTLSQLEKRQMLAEIYNKKLIDKGLAHSVVSKGENQTTLLINKIKMTEELTNGIMTDRSFLSELKKVGFKRIEFCEPSFRGGSNCQTFQIK